MITDTIYTQLINNTELTAELSTYKKVPAVFAVRAPDDVSSDWQAQQYTRIVFQLNTNADVERKISGLLQLNIHCPNSLKSEKLSEVAKAALDGYFISDNNETYSIEWDNTSFVRYEDSFVSTAVVIFRLLAFSMQVTGADRDPISTINAYTKELFPDASVIGYDTLSGAWKPSAGNPAIYWRHGERVEDYSLPTGAAATFYKVPLYGHVITGDAASQNSIARQIIYALYGKKVLRFTDGSVMRIDWDNRLNINADEYRDGQVTVKCTYCEQLQEPDCELLQTVIIK